MRLGARLTWVELKLFVREPVSVVFTFAFPLVVLVVLFGVFGDRPSSAFGSARPADYYLSSYLAVVIAAVGLIALPVHVATYRERGILRRLRASSVPAVTLLGAQVVVSLLLVTTGSIVLVAAGLGAYDASLPVDRAATVVGFGVASLSFLAVGFLIGHLARTARSAQAVGMLLFLPMWLLSGAGPPEDLLSDGLRTAAELMPLTYAVRAVREPWLGHGADLAALVVLAALFAVAGAVATARVRQL